MGPTDGGQKAVLHVPGRLFVELGVVVELNHKSMSRGSYNVTNLPAFVVGQQRLGTDDDLAYRMTVVLTYTLNPFADEGTQGIDGIFSGVEEKNRQLFQSERPVRSSGRLQYFRSFDSLRHRRQRPDLRAGSAVARPLACDRSLRRFVADCEARQARERGFGLPPRVLRDSLANNCMDRFSWGERMSDLGGRCELAHSAARGPIVRMSAASKPPPVAEP
jgi:hypothetical protein